MAQQKKAESGASFVALMTRLTGNFAQIDEERLEGVMDNYHRLFQNIGWDRFAVAVDKCIFEGELLFMPTITEFKKFVPESGFREKQAEERKAWERDMHTRRRAHPEEFFGEADVILMMRMVEKAKAENKPIPTESEIHKAIYSARKQYGDPVQVISEKEYGHFEN